LLPINDRTPWKVLFIRTKSKSFMQKSSKSDLDNLFALISSGSSPNSELTSNLKHCRAANFTDGFCRFFAVLHRYLLWILSFSFGTALHTVHHGSKIHPLSLGQKITS